MRQQDKLVRGYDRLAPWYAAIETLRFGRGLQRSRVALLDRLPCCENALFIGDGDGRLLEAFVVRQPACRVTSVDVSDGMLTLQQSRLSNITGNEHLQFIQADVRNWTPATNQYDLIVTAYHLDCFSANEVNEIIERLTQSLRHNGCWYVVDFAIPHTGWRRLWAQAWSAVLIAFFRWQTGLQTRRIVDLRGHFERQGWTAIVQHESRSGFQFSAIMQQNSPAADRQVT